MSVAPAIQSNGRMPQLDGLRAGAVTAVAISHWTPNFLAGVVPWGTGVQLFFVLSGFLITGILLGMRPAETGTSLGSALRVFYLRRALRIFPVYYVTLAVCVVLGVGGIRETWPWHFAYLSNFYYAFHPYGPAATDPYLHFWSLGVEEQFYLVWPFVALLISRRATPVILLLTLLGSTLFRLTVDLWLPGVVSLRYLTPSCLDAFAVGALLAHVRHYSGGPALRRMVRPLAAVGTAGLLISVLLLPPSMGHLHAHRVGHTFLVILYGAFVAGAAEGFGGWLGRVLEFRPVVFLGQVSYGVYVYHYFAPAALRWLTRHTGLDGLHRPAIELAAYVAFTLTVTLASWYLLEVPISRLKKRVPYSRAKPSPPAVVATAAVRPA